MQKINTVGIVGARGEFGRLIQHWAPKRIKIKAYGLKSDFTDITDCDVLFLSIPVQSFAEVLIGIKPYLRPECLVVDVCSVKLASQELIFSALPEHNNVLISHPMFGPQTAWESLEEHQFVVCEEKGWANEFVNKIGTAYKMNVIRMSADEHDKTMAQVHALTLFLARGVSAVGVRRQKIHAPSFDWVLGLAELDAHHSDALMETIETYNPYAASVRRDILEKLADLDSKYTD